MVSIASAASGVDAGDSGMTQVDVAFWDGAQVIAVDFDGNAPSVPGAFAASRPLSLQANRFRC